MWAVMKPMRIREKAKMIFQYRNYKNGKESIEWISVDKLYLDKFIKERKL